MLALGRFKFYGVRLYMVFTTNINSFQYRFFTNHLLNARHQLPVDQGKDLDKSP